jgi:hypothetical protein
MADSGVGIPRSCPTASTCDLAGKRLLGKKWPGSVGVGGSGCCCWVDVAGEAGMDHRRHINEHENGLKNSSGKKKVEAMPW